MTNEKSRCIFVLSKSLMWGDGDKDLKRKTIMSTANTTTATNITRTFATRAEAVNFYCKAVNYNPVAGAGDNLCEYIGSVEVVICYKAARAYKGEGFCKKGSIRVMQAEKVLLGKVCAGVLCYLHFDHSVAANATFASWTLTQDGDRWTLVGNLTPKGRAAFVAEIRKHDNAEFGIDNMAKLISIRNSTK